jgi:phage-related protein
MNNIEEYQNSRGDKIVSDFLDYLSNSGRAEHAERILKDLEKLEKYDLGFLLRSGVAKKLDKNIYELIVNWKNANYRILFSIIDKSFWLTNIFYKKSQKTPLRELELSDERRKILENKLN